MILLAHRFMSSWDHWRLRCGVGSRSLIPSAREGVLNVPAAVIEDAPESLVVGAAGPTNSLNGCSGTWVTNPPRNAGTVAISGGDTSAVRGNASSHSEPGSRRQTLELRSAECVRLDSRRCGSRGAGDPVLSMVPLHSVRSTGPVRDLVACDAERGGPWA